MRAKVLDDKTVDHLLVLYNRGASISRLAAACYVSNTTVFRALHNSGKYMKQKIRTESTVSMMMHDWNAGKQSNSLAATYGYRDAHAFRCAVDYYRRRGWNFNKRGLVK